MSTEEVIMEHDDGGGSSSSGEEDGDEQWKAAIAAVASVSQGCPPPSKLPPTSTTVSNDDDEDGKPPQTQSLKHYQIKTHKALDDMLEKYLVMVKDPDPIDVVDDPQVNEGGVRLFKQAPVGIVFDHRVELKGPRKKHRILPGEDIDEKSKKFKRRLKSVAVEGTDILACAENAYKKSLAKFEAKQAAARDAAKREEERVAELKKIRGERWLPSITREMQAKSRGR